MRRILIGTIITILSSVFTIAFAAKSISLWQQLARQDLLALDQIIRSQTPGAVDINNQHYQQWLSEGLKKSLEKLSKVKDYRGYEYLLRFYVNGFVDNQLKLSFDFNDVKTPILKKYPGFFLHYKNNKFLISAIGYRALEETTLPPVGAELQMCDGIVPSLLMQRNIFPFLGHKEFQSDWLLYTPWLLLQTGNPWAESILSCVFYFNGRRHHLRLTWQNLPEDFKIMQVVYSYQPKLAINDFTKNRSWIYLSTFSGSSSKKNKILKKIVAQLPELRKKNLVVFDLRGNQGKNGLWIKKMLRSFYGHSYYDWAMTKYFETEKNSWRVSPQNKDFLQERLLPQLIEVYGKTGIRWLVYEELLQEMQAAIAANHNLITEPVVGLSATQTIITNAPSNPVKAEVMVLVDGRCQGACLEFLHEMQNISGVIIIGQQTAPYSGYVTQRSTKLPSGFTEFTFPIHLVKSSVKKYNQPVTPQYIFEGDINDTTALQSWVLRLSAQ